MSERRHTVMVECHWCEEKGHYPGSSVVCQFCWGRRTIEHVLNCDHLDSLWESYGTVGDPQWDGANVCGICDALFAIWPRETW